MKTKNKILFFSSLFTSLILGGLFAKPILARLYPLVATVHSIVIARDIGVYTQEADIVVVGKVAEVGDVYLNKNYDIPQRDVTVDVSEVLKGNTDMGEVTVVIAGGHVGQKKVIMEDEARLKVGEKVLLFLGTNNLGEHVVFAGPYGKYLIHEDNQVTSIGDFSMDLDDLKAEIIDELKNGEPSPLVKSVPIEDQE